MEETEKGSGWLLFASVMLIIAGVYNFIWGIGALAKDDLYVTRLLFANLTFWGWVWLIVGVLQVIAGFGVLSKNQAARWFGIVMATISAIIAFFYIWAVPVWVLVIISLDVLVIYGLGAYGAREPGAM
jgi:uncharacterized membrane protein HdeD (DUF308 family)